MSVQMVTVASVAPIVGETIDPQKRTSEIFAHYSIPAFDDGAEPVLEEGSEIKSIKTAFPRGSVLFSKLNPRISRVWHVDDTQDATRICSTEFLPLNPDPSQCAPRYLAWVLRAPLFVGSFAGPSAATKSRERIKPNDLAEALIPLPSMSEQRRIADRLDAAMADIAAARAALVRQREEAAYLHAAAVELALGGRAIAAASDPDAVGSDWVTLAQAARLESGHTPSRKHPEWWGGDVPWIALPDIRALDGTTATTTGEQTNALGLANSSARLLPVGTVVFCRDVNVGYVTVMGTPMATSQHFVNWVPGRDLRSWYLAYALINARRYLRDLSEGSLIKTLYMPMLKGLRVRLPSLAEQDRALSRIAELRAARLKIVAALDRQAAALDALGPALLTAAFQGQL